MTAELVFSVYGIPQTAGSKRAFPFKRANGKLGVAVSDMNPKGKDWKVAVVAAALAVHAGALLDEPLAVDVTFVMPRPRSHYRTGKHAGELRPDAPLICDRGGDSTKLFRCLEDALNGTVWRDDRLVAHQTIRRIYGARPGAHVRIESAEVAFQSEIRARAPWWRERQFEPAAAGLAGRESA